MLSFLYCVWNARRLIKHPDGWIALGFAVLVIVISSQDVWRDAFSFARVFSPLLFLTALDCSAHSLLGVARAGSYHSAANLAAIRLSGARSASRTLGGAMRWILSPN